jgi:hypothetical protein
MTMTDDARDIRDIAGDAPGYRTDDDAEACRLARELWRAEGRPSAYGAELGRRVRRSDGTERSPRWGSNQVQAARAEDAAGADPGATVVPIGTPVLRDGRADSSRETGTSPAPLTTARRNTAGQAARRRPPAPAQPDPARAPLPLVVLVSAGVGMVTAVCALVSYSHLRHLSVMAGMTHAAVLPFAIDGYVLVCAGALLVDRHRGITPGSRAARFGLLIAGVASLMGNAVAVDPTLAPMRLVRFVLAVYPPLAMALALHVGDRVFRHHDAGGAR